MDWESNNVGMHRVFSSQAPWTLFEIILPEVPTGEGTVVGFGLYSS